MTNLVLFQVIFVLQSFYRVPKEQIVAGLTDFLKYKGITIKEKKIVQRALELWREGNVEIVDCYLVASLEKDARNILYSYDQDFDKFIKSLPEFSTAISFANLPGPS